MTDDNDVADGSLFDDGGEVESQRVAVESRRPFRAACWTRVAVPARVVGNEAETSVGTQAADEVMPDHMVLGDPVREHDRRLRVVGSVGARVQAHTVERLDPRRRAGDRADRLVVFGIGAPSDTPVEHLFQRDSGDGTRRQRREPQQPFAPSHER
jgi:hypothetical protein